MEHPLIDIYIYIVRYVWIINHLLTGMHIQVAILNSASGKQRGFIIRAEVEESPLTRVRRAQWRVSHFKPRLLVVGFLV